MNVNIKNDILAVLGDFAFGMTLSGLMTKLMPEAIHAVSTIVTGLVLTACVFFLNRALKKMFPDKNYKIENENIQSPE